MSWPIDTPVIQKKGEEREAHFTKMTDECAHGIVFLLEKKFVTGINLDVYGGISLSKQLIIKYRIQV